MRIREFGAEERPREKLLERGAGALTSAELLAILLRSGTPQMNVMDVARELLRISGGSLSGVSALSIDKMSGIKGIGRIKAAGIAAAFEISRRFASEKSELRKVSITSPQMVYDLVMPFLKGLDHEECWILFLNRANYVISKEKLSLGGGDATVIDKKVIARKCLEKGARGIIVVHNHPSGNPYPGNADIQETEGLKKALDSLEISLVDHVVVCDDAFYSFTDGRMYGIGG